MRPYASDLRGEPSGLLRNNDPNQRPSNGALRFWAGFWTAFWALLFGVGAAVGYVFLTDHHPIGILSILFFVLGVASDWACIYPLMSFHASPPMNL